jgi:hypothetical protein
VAKTPVVSAIVAKTPVAYHSDWSATTPTYSQGALLGGFACAPTSLSMVTAHFHAVNPKLGTLAPEAMAASAPASSVEAGKGVPYSAMTPELTSLGYAHISGHKNATQAELITGLETGPVIITAGGDTRGKIGSHSLVVVGITSDNSSVLINDPATGKRVSLGWSTFEKLWSGGNRGIIVIRP